MLSPFSGEWTISKKSLKIIAIFSCFLVLILSVDVSQAENSVIKESECYGFVIPLPQGEDTTIETFENSRVRHMINDLLREDISVFWLKENFSALVKRLNSADEAEEIYFLRGAFIVPFLRDSFKDALLTSIVFDYNQTHELEDGNPEKNEAYILLEEINVDSLKLVEPKIAQHFGLAVRYGWPSYLEIVNAGGFLTIEFLLDSETHHVLNNEDFNVFIWPYLPAASTYYEQFISLANTKNTNAIRQFINNGGGYVGTCYGAYAASSGLISPFSLFYLRYAYNPNLLRKSPGLALSISDSLMSILLKTPINDSIVIHKAVNTNHPLFYGANETFQDFFRSPSFVWLGKNTHVLSVFDDLKTGDGSSNVNKNLERVIVRRPSWVNSTFGKGKIILFGSHPDFINNIKPLSKLFESIEEPYYGRRIIQNSLFYLTSVENQDPIHYGSYNSSFINSILEKTNNLTINETSYNEFEEIIQNLNELNNDISNLNNTLTQLREIFPDFLNKSKYFPKSYRFFDYSIWLSEMFQDYIDKTILTLNQIDRIIPMLMEYNESLIDKVTTLKNDINNRLTKAKEIVLKSSKFALNIKAPLTSSHINLLQKLKLIKDRRNLLQTFEIELKYIPQIYFETLKLVRYCWYNYEANIAIDSIS